MNLITKLFYIRIENPFKTWWKVRKYFKLPEIRIYKQKYTSGPPYKNGKGNLLYIWTHDLFWKDKFNSPRHEVNPICNIILFNKIRIIFSLNPKKCDDHIYWETLLDFLYYGFSLQEAIRGNTWKKLNKDELYDCSMYIKDVDLNTKYVK